eukprot:gene14720-biopygen400
MNSCHDRNSRGIGSFFQLGSGREHPPHDTSSSENGRCCTRQTKCRQAHTNENGYPPTRRRYVNTPSPQLSTLESNFSPVTISGAVISIVPTQTPLTQRANLDWDRVI